MPMEDFIKGMHPLIGRLWKEKGFSEPTLPQKKAIPLILNGFNVLLVAPTGTGKTEAAFLPLLSKILTDEYREGIKLLYITPLRTLNRDLLTRLEWWALKLDLKISVRHGDTSLSERRIQAVRPPDILITTPETLQLMIIGKRLRETLQPLKYIIIDEIHEIADSKRGTQLSILLMKLREILGRDFQIIGLSATIGNPEEVAEYMFSFTRDFKVIYAPVSKLFEVDVEWPDIKKEDIDFAENMNTLPSVVSRTRFIKEIIEKHKSVLIFTNTKPTAEILGSRIRLIDENLPVYVHHGSLSQNQRVKIEEMLRNGEIKGIVCTSSMELGIDIGYIDKVIQYNSPREVKRLIQRVGRSGHSIGEKSRGTIIVGNTNEALESIVIIQKLKEEKIEDSIPYEKPLDVLTHEIIGFILIGMRRVSEIYEIIRRVPAYRSLSFQEFEDLINFIKDIGLVAFGRNDTLILTPRAYEYFYSTLSTIPEIKQYIVKDEENNIIGLLDDFFVSEYLEPGSTFFIGGKPWEVVAISDKDVVVRETDDYIGAIPSWIGEEIPVPYDTAIRVGEIRKIAKEYFKKGYSLEEISKEIGKITGIRNIRVIYKAFKSFYENLQKGFHVPTSDRIVVEKCRDMVVIYTHFGNRINRALGKYIAYRLSRLYGFLIYVSEKPYYIILKSENLDIDDVVSIIKNTSPSKFKEGIVNAAIESRIFRWRLQQIARKMGVIEYDRTLTRSELERLLLALKDTPVYSQALREVLDRDLNIPKSIEIIGKIYEGMISVVKNYSCSPFTREILSVAEEYLEIVKPGKREMLEMLILKSKILSSFVSLCCNECGYIEEIPVLKLKNSDRLTCTLCYSDTLAFDVISESEMNLRYRRCRNSKKGKGCRNYWRSISLLKRYGVKAIYARVAGLSFTEIEDFMKETKMESENVFLRKLCGAVKRKMAQKSY